MNVSTRSRILVVAALSSIMLPGLTACSNAGADQTTLTIFAASSLTETFGELKTSFENDHPDVDVVLSFGSSSALAEQINQGSPADVIATADDKSIGLVASDGNLTGDPTQFATNTLVIVTPPDNPAGIASLDDLADADFVMCDPSAPCGAAAKTILASAGITAEPRSLEADVKSVLTKVELDEADAGLVYVTDAQAAGEDVHAVDIPSDVNVTNPYFIGVAKDSDERDLAEEWVSLVNSQSGQRVLREAGFGAP